MLAIAVLCLFAAFGSVINAGAAILIDEQTFDADDEGWVSDDGWATVSWVDEGGGEGWLKTEWTELTGDDLDPGPWWFDTFTNSADNLFAGDWETNMYFTLDFWASNNAPDAVQILWGATNETRVWKNTIYDNDDDSMNMTNWTTWGSATFNDFSDWRSPPLEYDADNFVQDLAAIDWIGIKIFRGDAAADVYGIDNVRLMVPEPAEIIFLLFAGMTSWLSMKKKRKGKNSVSSEQ